MGEARLGRGGGGAGGGSLKAGGFPEEAWREPERVCKGRGGCDGLWACCARNWQTRRAARGSGGTQTERWPGRGVPLPSGGKDSTKVTLCPQNHKFPWHGGIWSGEGEGSKGQGVTPGAEGKKRKGEIGRRKSSTGLPETCHPGRVGHQLLHSLPPSLPPLPVPAACQQARRARGQEVLACFPVVTKRQGRRSTFLHPTPSLSSCPDREQGDALLPHPPFSLLPHPIPRCDVPHRGLQGSCVAGDSGWGRRVHS